MSKPSRDELAKALLDAGEAHHDYEQVVLGGKRDEQWPGFYAAYALGRLGNFVSPSILSNRLENAPSGDDWPTTAADHVLNLISE